MYNYKGIEVCTGKVGINKQVAAFCKYGYGWVEYAGTRSTNDDAALIKFMTLIDQRHVLPPVTRPRIGDLFGEDAEYFVTDINNEFIELTPVSDILNINKTVQYLDDDYIDSIITFNYKPSRTVERITNFKEYVILSDRAIGTFVGLDKLIHDAFVWKGKLNEEEHTEK